MHLTRNETEKCVMARIVRQKKLHQKNFTLKQFGTWTKAETAAQQVGQGDPGRTAAAHRHEEPDDQPQHLGRRRRAPGACGATARGQGISGLALDRLLARLPELGRHRLVGEQVRRRARVRAGLPGAQARDASIATRSTPSSRRSRRRATTSACSSSSRSPRPEGRGQGRRLNIGRSGACPAPAGLRCDDRPRRQDGQPGSPLLRPLGRAPYEATVDAMKAFTAARGAATPDEIWLVEHPPVFTQGLAGKAEHLLDAGDVPVVQTNRGGQVTYHGPGPGGRLSAGRPAAPGHLRQGIRVPARGGRAAHAGRLRRHRPPRAGRAGHLREARRPVRTRRAGHGPAGRATRSEGLGKIAALGVKVSNHCTYHGVALNVAMDLQPFERINPCGYAGLKTVDLATLGVVADWATVADVLGRRLRAQFTR